MQGRSVLWKEDAALIIEVCCGCSVDRSERSVPECTYISYAQAVTCRDSRRCRHVHIMSLGQKKSPLGEVPLRTAVHI